MTSIRIIKKRFEQITNAVSRLVEDKYFFKEYKKYLEEHPSINKNNEFLYFIGLNYVEATTVGIFRQVDKDRRSQSLFNILNTILTLHKSFTIEKFSRKYLRVGLGLSHAKKDFAEFSIKDGTKISPKKVKSDIVALLKITKPVVKYRHKFVAHKNIRKVSINTKMNDLYSVIDFMEKLIIKYQLLLNQAGMETLLPQNLVLDLKEVFKE